MARHASPLNPTATRALIALATASAALGAGAATASANTEPSVSLLGVQPASLSKINPQVNDLQGPTSSVKYVTGSRQGLKPAGVDPKGNGTEIPLTGLTGPVTQTGPIGAVPTLEGLQGLFGGGLA